jgi:hypothetical protein
MITVRRRMLIALFIVLVAAGGAQAQAPSGWEDLERKALQAIVAGKGTEAVALLQRFVTGNPDFAEGHSMLASAHSAAAESLEEAAGPAAAATRRRHLEAAAGHYRRTLDLTHVNRTLNQLSLAELYGPGRLNQPAEAEKFARLMGDALTATWNGQALLAWALSETGRANEATGLLERARRATPADDRLKLGVAVAELAKQRGVSRAAARLLLAEALAVADAAIAADGANWQAWMFKSVVVQAQASQVEQDPGRKAALLAESSKLWERGRELNTGARAAERAQAALQPAVPEGWYEDSLKARELAGAGKHAAALAIYEKYATRHPTFAEAHTAVAAAHESLGDGIKATGTQPSAARRRHFETAATHYRRAAELSTATEDMPMALWAVTQLYGAERLNRPADAEALARDAVKRYPTDPASHAMLVKILATTGQSNAVGAVLATARTAVPTTPEARQKLGVYLYDVVSRDPKLPAADARALVAEANAAFDRALESKPEYMEALVYKSLALRLQAERFEPDAARARALIAEADRLRARAMELQKRKLE